MQAAAEYERAELIDQHEFTIGELEDDLEDAKGRLAETEADLSEAQKARTVMQVRGQSLR